MEEIREFLNFLATTKKWWLFPLVLFLLILGLLIIIGESSVIAPFVYSVF